MIRSQSLAIAERAVVKTVIGHGDIAEGAVAAGLDLVADGELLGRAHHLFLAIGSADLVGVVAEAAGFLGLAAEQGADAGTDSMPIGPPIAPIIMPFMPPIDLPVV